MLELKEGLHVYTVVPKEGLSDFDVIRKLEEACVDITEQGGDTSLYRTSSRYRRYDSILAIC